jgi:alanine-glyoxylate transaminase/serine-glyoxylate transaminase/serine-pyruvate transaminase
MNQTLAELNPSPRLLLGPGPSSVHPRVLRAMSTPLLGYLDPEFITMLGETQDLLRQVFQTQNTLTLPVSGTGMAGMETLLANLLEPGDRMVVCTAGFFGNRLEEVALRLGAQVAKVEKPWGEVFAPEEVEAALRAHPAKVLAVVHAETSTGALQPLEELGEIAHRHGALLLVDCVTSLGGVPIKLDEWGIDAAYSGTQKCLGCPPGLAPVSLSDRARDAIRSRRTKPSSWYFDLKFGAVPLKSSGTVRLTVHRLGSVRCLGRIRKQI